MLQYPNTEANFYLCMNIVPQTPKEGSDTIIDGTPSKIYSAVYCPKPYIYFKSYFLWLIDLATFKNERQNTK